MDEDYLYYVEAAAQHKDVWKSSGALKWDISQNREEWLKLGHGRLALSESSLRLFACGGFGQGAFFGQS